MNVAVSDGGLAFAIRRPAGINKLFFPIDNVLLPEPCKERNGKHPVHAHDLPIYVSGIIHNTIWLTMGLVLWLFDNTV